ncbi:MaoC/PaaZ C-terminal domain-containing protein [Seohaeicola zhoushanensis]|uniref:MaoC-like domain-containing protein n=1 Tax=Seohaeicola zhoushanensis TaxID=1569283 RepID=A0A8J3H1J2_9RHOB|nr:MaoC/PaaZ C-terminal domain-containing protein [Seohaeicola zhoushanensis]GHF64725.1 hypothetical protein GCM10017056_39890 [Seohaeicola zhoushanensis]
MSLLPWFVTLTYCRGDGGCGSLGETVALNERVPERMPDMVTEVAIPPGAALLYRLAGDTNPLHADPNYATAAGFPRQILHRLCSFAAAGRTICGRVTAPEQLQCIGGRFSGVAYPGGTLAVAVWQSGPRVQFRAFIGDRTVIDSGLALVAPGGADQVPGQPMVVSLIRPSEQLHVSKLTDTVEAPNALRRPCLDMGRAIPLARDAPLVRLSALITFEGSSREAPSCGNRC